MIQVQRPAGGVDLLLVGGDKLRHSMYYDTVADAWSWLPMLPPGHIITCNVACNWQNKAVFTFLVDGALNIKSAVLDLAKMDPQVTKEAATSEMTWAFKSEYKTAAVTDEEELAKMAADGTNQHHIDRFHVKSAEVMPDNSIVVLARGRLLGMREAITTLFLRFDVSKVDGEYKLTMRDKVERAFPTIFPRQLDYMQRNGQKLVCVQDTADNDDFEVMVVDLMTMRRDNVHQTHKVIKMNKLIMDPK